MQLQTARVYYKRKPSVKDEMFALDVQVSQRHGIVYLCKVSSKAKVLEYMKRNKRKKYFMCHSMYKEKKKH